MKIIHILFALIMLGGWSCSPKVQTSMENSRKLSNYNTYAWVGGDQQTKNPVYNSEMIDDEIRDAVNQELKTKGFELSESNPDFFVRYKTYVEKETNISGGGYNYGPAFGWGGGYYGYRGGWGWGGSPASTYTTNKGTLIIEAIDAKSNKVIWRGFADGNVDNPKKLNSRIDKGVKSIMKNFPS